MVSSAFRSASEGGRTLPFRHLGMIVALFNEGVCDGGHWAGVMKNLRGGLVSGVPQEAASDAIVRGAHPSKIAKGEAAKVMAA
jgi:hypothetical protein